MHTDSAADQRRTAIITAIIEEFQLQCKSRGSGGGDWRGSNLRRWKENGTNPLFYGSHVRRIPPMYKCDRWENLKPIHYKTMATAALPRTQADHVVMMQNVESWRRLENYFSTLIKCLNTIVVCTSVVFLISEKSTKHCFLSNTVQTSELSRTHHYVQFIRNQNVRDIFNK